MQVIHTSYIKRLADQTGKTYRDLESIWKKFEREVENDRMFDPNKFSHMRTIDGTMAQEVARRFEKFLVDPLGVESEKQEESVDEVQDELLADEIENDMEEDISSEVEDVIADELPVEETDVEVDVEKTDVDEEPSGDEAEGEGEGETNKIDDEDAEPEIDLNDFEDLTDL